MVNPYSVRSASQDIIQGLGMGLAGYSDYKQREQMAERQQQQSALEKQLMSAVQAGDPNAMYELMRVNPDLAESTMEVSGYADRRQRDATGKAALNYLTGTIDSEQLVKEQVSILKQNNQDPRAILQWGMMPEGEQKRKAAEMVLAVNSPDLWERYQSIQGVTSDEQSTAGIRDFEYYQNLKKENPEAARQFGIERGFITKEGQELSGFMQKRLATATDDAIDAEKNVGRYNVLADDIEKADIGGGLLGATWKESLKEITGTQDAVSDLRKKYAGIRASQVVNNLPPGAASDKDIEMAISGFPSDKASGDQIAGFMRGLAKLEQLRADYANFKADFISNNGTERGMLKAWKEYSKDMVPEQPQGAQAPQAAIDYLMQNPNLAEQFREKYGYLPEGLNNG